MFKKNRKTYKTTERKGNPRRELQGGVNHCSKTLSDSGVVSNDFFPFDKTNIGFVKSELDRFFGNGKNDLSVVMIRHKK